MKHRKPSDIVLKKLMRRQLVLKNQIEDAKIIGEGADTKFWKTFKDKVKDKRDSIEAQLNGFESLTQDQRTILLAQKKTIAIFLNIPEDFAADLERMNRQLEDVRVKIDEYRGRLSGRN